MAKPLVEVRHGANAFVQLVPGVPFAATAGATLDIRLADTAGVVSWEIECIDTDETSTVLPVTRNAPPAMSATVPIPSGSGKSFLFRSRVNGGKANGRNDPMLHYTFLVYLAAPNGLRVGTTNETYEGSATHGWIGPINQAIRTAGLTAMPTGTGIVTTSGGTGATLPYGAAYTFARMNSTGTVLEWVTPIVTDAGLEMVSGQIGAKVGGSSGLQKDSAGLALKLPVTSGLQKDATGTWLKLDETGGTGFSGLVLAAAGLKVKFDTSMVTGANGIGVDPAKWAALSGGKHTAAQARGLTMSPTFFKVEDASAMPTALPVTTTTFVDVMALSLGTLAVGDVIDVNVVAVRDGTANAYSRLQITSSATANAGTIYSTLLISTPAGGAVTGLTVSGHDLFTVTTAGAHWVHFTAAKQTSGDGTHNYYNRRLTAKIQRA